MQTFWLCIKVYTSLFLSLLLLFASFFMLRFVPFEIRVAKSHTHTHTHRPEYYVCEKNKYTRIIARVVVVHF